MVLYGDVFGLDGASDERSGEVALRIAAPLYKASGKVVAVVIDDAYLTRRKTNWPLRYQEQGAIMRRILAAKPAGMVVDFIYPHQHAGSGQPGAKPDEIGDLTALLDDNTDIPVIFVAQARTPLVLNAPDEIRNADDDTHELPEVRCRDVDALVRGPPFTTILNLSSINAALLEWVQVGEAMQHRPRRLAYIGWSDCGERYPNFFEGDPQKATPAFAAFLAYCETHHAPGDGVNACRMKGADAAATGGPAESYLSPMTLRSGAYPPADQVFAYQEQCQKPADAHGHVPLWKRLVAIARQLAFSIFGDPRTSENREIALPCPAVTVLPYSSLVAASPTQWSELLGGRMVVLGANISGIPDVVPTAVHGQIAGAVWHAMALDNLLAQGTGYLHEADFWNKRVFTTLLAILFAYSFPLLARFYEHEGMKRVLAVAGLLAWMTLSLLYLSEGNAKLAGVAALLGISLDVIKPTYSAVYFVALGLAAVIALVLSVTGHPSGNWIGLVLVVAGIMHTLKAYYKGEEAKQLPHPLSVLMRVWKLGVQHATRR